MHITRLASARKSKESIRRHDSISRRIVFDLWAIQNSRCTISAHARRESVGGGCAAFERHVTGADEGTPQQPRCRTAQIQLLPTSSTEV